MSRSLVDDAVVGFLLLKVEWVWGGSNLIRPTSYLLLRRRIANGFADNWGVRLVHKCFSLVNDAVVDCLLQKVEWV